MYGVQKVPARTTTYIQATRPPVLAASASVRHWWRFSTGEIFGYSGDVTFLTGVVIGLLVLCPRGGACGGQALFRAARTSLAVVTLDCGFCPVIRLPSTTTVSDHGAPALK